LSIEGKKGIRVGKIPRWEAELWSHVGGGDSIHCPLHSRCPVRKQGGWCPDDNKERLNQLLAGRKFNPRDYDFIEDVTKECGRLHQLVEMLAQKYLKMGGVHRPPVPAGIIKLFDQQHAIEVRQVPLKVYHGAIWSRNDEWVIQIKDNDAFATRRFTLFHEAFHILAHCRTSPVFRKRGSILGSFNELLADYFALCALMPREWVRQKWTEVEDLNRMAEIFAVPKSAMCIRLRQLGLI
jgi:hypothetical protein